MADTSSVPPAIVTSNESEFIGALQDGDILLFHTLRDISQLIRFVDNSPVNHCALYRENGKTIGCKHVIVHASTHRAGEMAVREDSLRCRLGNYRDRTVTALRRPGKSIAADVFPVADQWLDDATRYGYKDLPSLATQCINRSYGNDKDRSEIAKAVMDAASRVMRFSTAIVPGDPKLSVTCSEFVYTCYIAAASDSIWIRDPLAYAVNGRRRQVYFVTRGRRQVFRLIGRKRPGTAGPDLGFPDGGVVLPAPSSAPSNPRSFKGRLTRERLLTRLEAQVNDENGKNIPPPKQSPAPYAQTVTPFDLWQSPSLTVVKVLHRPPAPGDLMYERTGGRTPPPVPPPKRRKLRRSK